MDVSSLLHHDVRKCEMLSSDEQKRLARIYRKTKNPEVRNRLIESIMPWCIRCAKGFHKQRGLPIEDLNQYAFLGAIEAVDTYDPRKGCLTTWSRFHIRKHMLYSAINASLAIRIPNVLICAVLNAQFDPDTFVPRINKKTGNKSGWCSKGFQSLYAQACKVTRNWEPLDGESSKLHDEAFDAVNEIAEQSHREFVSEKIQSAIGSLNDARLQYVVTERMNGKKLCEIALVLGVTRERVRQIQNKGYGLIKKYLLENTNVEELCS